MKKNFRKVVVSIALSLSMCCTLFGVACMGIFKPVQTVAEPVVLTGFTMDEGAAVRKSEPNGIRFTTYLNETAKDAAKALSNVKYGTLLLPSDILGAEELTLETDKVVNLEISKWKDDYTYQSVLTGTQNNDGTYNNLPESYYNRPIAARGYVQGMRGNELVTYYSENTTVRSIGYVAYMADLDGDTSSLIDTIVDKTKVELSFNENEQISAFNTDAQSGAVIIANAFDKSTDNAASIKVGGVEVPADALNGASIAYTSSATGVVAVNGSTLTAVSEGEATITATATFNGKQLTATKTMSTNAYKLFSEYKILISEAAESGPLNSGTSYLPMETKKAYNTYYNAFEKTAAYKLQSILEEATGVRLEVVTQTESGCKYISVGETDLVSASKLSDATLAKDTASEVTVDVDGNVIIRGTTQRGTLYGVQQLLKDLVGYEYYLEDTYSVNDVFELVLAENKSYIPDMEYNVLQGDLQSSGVMDEYAFQMYTEGVVPIGTTVWEDANGHYYKGVAHNSVILLNDGAYAGVTAYNTNDTNADTWQKWYATDSTQIKYKTTLNPYYSGKDDVNTSPNEGVKTMLTELCYTAHGDGTVRTAMVNKVVEAMYAKMQKFPAFERIGFAHMDHRDWCECTTCTNHGNPSDNVLEFLLDVAAGLKTKLANAGDARAETFKISSLFYHATNRSPKSTANYKAKLTSYMKHVEPWFAESGADHIDAYELTEEEKAEIAENNYTGALFWKAENNWNATTYEYLVSWSNLCDTYQADMLFWAYYANTTSFFIPFNTFDAIRRNYGTFAEQGVDYVFNQMMESKQNWARFKEFLMSKLLWNANPTPEEWEAWYGEYFNGAFGSGATAMRSYFDAWSAWADENVNAFRRNGQYDYTDDENTSSMGFDLREETGLLGTSELIGWINHIDNALAALDTNDPKYDIYRKNIMLEKLTPMYLLMWMHDGYTPVMDTVNTWLPDPTQAGTFASTTYVKKYGSEFLTWVKEWDIAYDGEGAARKLAPFLTAIENKGFTGGTVTTNKYVSERQYLDVNENATFAHTALLDGSYTVSGAVSGTAKVLAGETTLNASALTAGQSYTVVFTNDATGGVTTFADVLAVNKLSATDGAVSNSNGYYYIDKTYFIEEGETQLWLKHDVLQKGTYTVTANGEGATASTYIAGELKVATGTLSNGQACEVICVDANNNTYVFKVISAKFIRTAQELQALGVGGKNEIFTYNNEERTYGNGNSDVFGNDVTGYYALANDIDCAGVVFAAGYSYGASYFQGTIDGNGYVLNNVSVNEGGIFGGMRDATVQNMTLCNVVYADNLSNHAGNWSNYTALFAHSARNTTFANIEINVKEAMHNASMWVLLDGMMVASTQENVLYANVAINAQGLDLVTVLGSNVDLATVVYSKYVVKANSYVAVGYTANEFPPQLDANGDPVNIQNTDALIVDFPEGVTFIKASKKFDITTTETAVQLGSSFAIGTNADSYNYTYTLLNEVLGVTLDGNMVSVSMDAKVGASFTVLVEEASEGLTRAIIFTIVKQAKTFDYVPTLETIKDTSFNLPVGLEGTVLTVTANGYVYYDEAKGIGSIVDGMVIPDALPVAQQYLGRGITLTIETENAIYTGAMNVYTMIIDNKAELDQWQEVAAQHAVDTGLCLEIQKGLVYSGYFVLGGDIQYNGTWMPYKAADNGGNNQLWSLVYTWDAAAGKSVVKPELYDKNGELLEGAIVEDWGAGNLAGFKGVFDGDGHSINGLETTGEYNAFIVTMGGGTIKDIAFTQATIGADASLIADRGSGVVENVYVQIASMESGTLSANDAQTVVLMRSRNVNATTEGMNSIIVDVSNVNYANLKNVFIADLGSVTNNGIYVVGMPQNVTFTSDLKQEAPLVFFACDNNDAAGAYVDTAALLADGTHGAIVKAWDSSFWKIDEENNLVLPINIYNDLMAVELSETVTIEQTNGSFTLPDEVEGNVLEVIVDGYSLTNISGKTVTLASTDFVAQETLGKGKEIIIVTNQKRYVGFANVYTMIIDNKAEFNQWQAVSAENAVKAGLVIEAQKGFTYSGYFVLGADIEYNDTWKPYKAYGELWGLCYDNAAIWTGGVKDSGSLIDGAFQEDWGTGNKAGFKGVFDGDGHYIDGLATSGEYSGFIVTGGGGTIKNVAFLNASVGAQSGYVFNRGPITLENVYVSLASVADGKSGAETNVLGFSAGGTVGRAMSNVLIDATNVDLSGWKYGYLGYLGNFMANGVYAIGTDGIPAQGTNVTDGNAIAFLHYNGSANSSDYDIAGAFDSAEVLLADATHGPIVKAWDKSFWSVTATNVLPKCLASMIVAGQTTAKISTSISGNAVVIGETAAIDVTEIVSYLTNGYTVTLDGAKLDVISLSGNTLTLKTAQLGKPLGEKELLILTDDGMKISLPVEIDAKIELNSSNVTSPAALQAILNSRLDGHFVLTSDLNMGGAGLKVVEAFSGILDGQGYAIMNTWLHHDADSDNGYAPRFLKENNGTVKNIAFLLDYMTYTTGAGDALRGIVNVNNGLVDNVYVSVTIKDSAKEGDYCRTGIISRVNNGTISNTIVDVTLASTATMLDGLMAGLAFENNGTITNSYTINNGASNILAVQKGEGGTTIASWADVDTSASAWGDVWYASNGNVYFGAYINASGKASIGNNPYGTADLSVFDGDETALGFAAGTRVYQANITDGWSSRITVNSLDANADYFSFKFSLGTAAVTDICMWPTGHQGSYNVRVDSGFSATSPADSRTILIYDENGNDVTAGPWAANTVYTMYIYCVGETITIDKMSISTFQNLPCTLYFADMASGDVIDLDETVSIDISVGEFALPTTIEGTVTGISLDGKDIFTSVSGGKAIFNQDAMPTTVSALGSDRQLLILADGEFYSLSATVATKFITTAEELQALGVGGQTVDGVAQGQGNSDVAGNDVTGYYMLANDIDASGLYFAAGYHRDKSWFKGAFDGNGYTVSNVIVSEGGIFGGMRDATIRNVNFANVRYHAGSSAAGKGYNNNQNWGFYTGLFADIADRVVIENVTVHVTEYTNNDYPERSSLFFGRVTTNSANTFTNVTIDASGLAISNVLHIRSNANEVYENVLIKAAGFTTMGYSDGGSTPLTEWPAGVTFKNVYHLNFVPLANDSSILPVYTGDVTALGFAAGTTVYEAVQDNRTDMWKAGTNLGLTMEQQGVMLTKAADEDYASVQISLSRDIESNHIFFTWWFDADGANKGSGGFLMADGSYNASGTTMPNPNAVAYDMNGNKVTSFKANTVYEIRWYGEGTTAFKLGCCEQNGEAITVYYANPSSGNDAA